MWCCNFSVRPIFVTPIEKEECGGTAFKCEKEELDLFWEAVQKYEGGRYKKNDVFEPPKRVGWNLCKWVLFSVLNVLVSFLQGIYTTSSTDQQAGQIQKNKRKET